VAPPIAFMSRLFGGTDPVRVSGAASAATPTRDGHGSFFPTVLGESGTHTPGQRSTSVGAGAAGWGDVYARQNNPDVDGTNGDEEETWNRVKRVYARYAPERSYAVDTQLRRQWAGRAALLLDAVCAKYGPEPRDGSPIRAPATMSDRFAQSIASPAADRMKLVDWGRMPEDFAYDASRVADRRAAAARGRAGTADDANDFVDGTTLTQQELDEAILDGPARARRRSRRARESLCLTPAAAAALRGAQLEFASNGASARREAETADAPATNERAVVSRPRRASSIAATAADVNQVDTLLARIRDEAVEAKRLFSARRSQAPQTLTPGRHTREPLTSENMLRSFYLASGGPAQRAELEEALLDLVDPEEVAARMAHRMRGWLELLLPPAKRPPPPRGRPGRK
jgi:hypothetical protein